ncbi:MAG: LacI family transcriptional regulator [Lentisphaerales bacterium]|nr:LacI family transcriptional regulator [Lentisphaerales bacterium]
MATLKDIANMTGVSIRTVSRALKNDGYIKEEVRQQVLEAAQKLNYTPNRMARSLRTNKSYEVCVLSWSTDELHMLKIAALEKSLRQHGYQTTLMVDSSEISDESKNEMIDDIIRRKPAGVVTLPAYVDHDKTALEKFTKAGVLCVAIDPRHTHKERVEIDRQEGIYQAVKELAEKYGPNTAYFGISSEGHNNTRLVGYRRAMQELGYKYLEYNFSSELNGEYEQVVNLVRNRYPSTELGFSDMANQYAAGLNAAKLVKENSPRAALVFSDLMCMGLLHGLNGSEIRIPQDLAIIGVDDRSCATLCSPPLSSIAHPNEEVGEAAAKILLENINEDKEAPNSYNLIPKLQKRLSS